MRILFYQRASIQKAYEGWQKGTYYAHVLFGLTHLGKYGLPCDNFDVKGSGFEIFINKLTGHRLDFAFHSFRILFQQRKYQLIYGSTADGMQLLSVFRKLRLLRIPVTTIVHAVEKDKETGLRKKLMRIFMQGLDHVFFLSTPMQQKAIRLFDLPADKTTLLHWGYDLNFLKQAPPVEQNHTTYFLSTGKTRRDFNTLVNAFGKTQSQVKIFYNPPSPLPRLNHQIIAIETANDKETPLRLHPEYANSMAVVIPVNDSEHICGTTNLMDAMAFGKPIIMTRNPNLEIDIEKEGIGIFVEVNDVDGWVAAVQRLANDENLRSKMGKKGQTLAQEQYNFEIFMQELSDMLKQLNY